MSTSLPRFYRMTACVAVLLTTTVAFAHSFKVGSLEIGHPWMRATPPGAAVAGGYLTITNTGSESDRLIEAQSQLAGRVTIHEMKMDGDVMQMREGSGGVEIKPCQKVELAPGGYHLMFTDLHGPAKEGEMVKGQLRFEKAGAVDIEYKVESVGSKGPHEKMQMDKDAPSNGHHHH